MRTDALAGLVLAALLPWGGGGTPSPGAEAPVVHHAGVRPAATTVGYYSDFTRKQSRRVHQQWSLDAVRAKQAWKTSRGAGVTIAVIDSGVGPTWELDGQVLPGLNLAGRPPRRVDTVDHGTAVASLIAARADGKGITGVAPAARLVPVRIFDGYESPNRRVVRAIRWAVQRHVDVINLSLVDRDTSAMRAAVRLALRKGVIVVAGAGNEGENGSPTQYPAAYPGVIAVGAIEQSRELADFSNRGSYVDVVAPGERVLASDPFDTLSWYSGTSFSTPVVTGVVALMKAADPGLRPAEAERILRRTAHDLGDPGKDSSYGYGLVDAARAVAAARRER